MNQFFTIYPAIDLRGGKVVRLQRGDPQRQTIFAEDALATAERWAGAGAQWLHVVNLDGAFDEGGAANWRLLAQLAGVGAHVQFGGGVRTLADVERALHMGATRVILGTVAVENPDLVSEALASFGPECIVIALDALHGRVKTRGWQADSGMDVIELGYQMKEKGVKTVLHTDISRDGILQGVNAEASAALAQTTGLDVIASGGIASLGDIERVLHVRQRGVTGVITGRALYEGRLDLAAALALVEARAREAEPSPPDPDNGGNKRC